MKTETLTEARAQRWRALLLNKDQTETLLILGSSYDQVKETYDEPYYDLLEEDERARIHEIIIQKWVGAPDRGTWVTQGVLPTPEKTSFVLPIRTKAEYELERAQK